MTSARILRADAVLFDLDGVLVDSTDAVERVWRDFAARHDLNPDELLTDLHGRRMIDIIRTALPGLDRAELRKEANRVVRAEVELGAAARAQPGALALAESLGDVPWAIVTSGSWPVAHSRIKATGLVRPDVIVTADDVVTGKPSPEPYFMAAKELSVDPTRCVVVEDAPTGIVAGRATEATVVAVTTSHAYEEVTCADHIVADTSYIRRARSRRFALELTEVARA